MVNLNVVNDNLNTILDKIAKAAEKTGRSSEDVKLVAVSKNIDYERIHLGIEAGLTTLGENKVQEFLKKYEHIGPRVKWHFVGYLQSNKAKDIIGKVELIHSLDRISLAKEIEKRAKRQSVVANALVQVNVAEEETKAGLSTEEVIPFIREVAERFPHINIRGLMTMPPFAEDNEAVRPFFRELKDLFEHIREKQIESVDMDFLSMGMTNDFEVAVEEGSNMVRIGRAIFGPREEK